MFGKRGAGFNSYVGASQQQSADKGKRDKTEKRNETTINIYKKSYADIKLALKAWTIIIL